MKITLNTSSSHHSLYKEKSAKKCKVGSVCCKIFALLLKLPRIACSWLMKCFKCRKVNSDCPSSTNLSNKNIHSNNLLLVPPVKAAIATVVIPNQGLIPASDVPIISQATQIEIPNQAFIPPSSTSVIVVAAKEEVPCQPIPPAKVGQMVNPASLVAFNFQSSTTVISRNDKNNFDLLLSTPNVANLIQNLENETAHEMLAYLLKSLKEEVGASQLDWKIFLSLYAEINQSSFFKITNAVLQLQNREIANEFITALNERAFNQFLEEHGDITVTFDSKNALLMNTNLLLIYMPFFNRMLGKGFKEDKELLLKEIDEEAFAEALLGEINEEINIDENNFQELLHISSEFDLPIVRKACETWLLKNSDDFDRKDLFDLAEMYDIGEIKFKLYNTLIETNTEWSSEEQELIKKWVPCMQNYKVTKIKYSNALFLFPLCVKDVYSDELVKDFLAELLVARLVKNNFQSDELELLKKWAPIADSLVINYTTKSSIEKLRVLFPYFTHVTTLKIWGNEHVEDSDLLLFPQLKKLSLWNANKVTINSLSSLKSLEWLSLTNSQLTDQCLTNLSPTIKNLDLGNAINISDKGIQYLPQKLKFLSITKNRNLTDNCLQYLPKQLTSLDLSETNITGKNFGILPKSISYLTLTDCHSLEILDYLPPIKDLNLQNCLIYDRDLENLPASLKTIRLYDCQNVSNQAIQKLRASNIKVLVNNRK